MFNANTQAIVTLSSELYNQYSVWRFENNIWDFQQNVYFIIGNDYDLGTLLSVTNPTGFPVRVPNIDIVLTKENNLLTTITVMEQQGEQYERTTGIVNLEIDFLCVDIGYVIQKAIESGLINYPTLLPGKAYPSPDNHSEHHRPAGPAYYTPVSKADTQEDGGYSFPPNTDIQDHDMFMYIFSIPNKHTKLVQVMLSGLNMNHTKLKNVTTASESSLYTIRTYLPYEKLRTILMKSVADNTEFTVLSDIYKTLTVHNSVMHQARYN